MPEVLRKVVRALTGDHVATDRWRQPEWEDEPADVHVRPVTTEVVSFRVTSDELDRIQEAARRRHLSVSELIHTLLQREMNSGLQEEA